MHDRQQRKWEVISRSDEVTKSTVGFTGDTFYTFFPVAAPPKLSRLDRRLAHFAMCCFMSLVEKWEGNFFACFSLFVSKHMSPQKKKSQELIKVRYFS